MGLAKRMRKLKMANKRPSGFTKQTWAEHADFGTGKGFEKKGKKK